MHQVMHRMGKRNVFCEGPCKQGWVLVPTLRLYGRVDVIFSPSTHILCVIQTSIYVCQLFADFNFTIIKSFILYKQKWEYNVDKRYFKMYSDDVQISLKHKVCTFFSIVL